MKGNNLSLKNTTQAEYDSIWSKYFDLTRDYVQMHEMFRNYEQGTKVTYITQALSYSPGLRLMKQDAWEVLISFVLSQNSNIPRIKKMIESLCENFGEQLPCGGYTFPTAQSIAALKAEDLSVIRSGYRAPYIIDAATQVANGTLQLDLLHSKPTAEIKKAILQVHGVGPKVADCVLLFGFGRLECIPVDVWIKKVLDKLYPAGFPKELQEYAGLAQQFLFHYARNHAHEFS